MSQQPNPRAVMGANLGNNAPDYAKEEVDRLARDYAELKEVTVPGLLAESAAIIECNDPKTKERVADLIKRQRDASRLILSFHEVEKQPHYRRGQGVDQFFFGMADRLARRDKKAKPGEADRLQDMLTDYDVRVLRAEQARRDEEARRLRAEQEERDRIAREAAEQADRDRLAAERARKPEAVEQKTAIADESQRRAVETAVDAEIATGKAQEATLATFAKPADIMRTRTESGTLSTMGTEPFAIVTDRALLDYAKLAPFFTAAAVDAALRAWARNTGYTVQMPGASVGKKPKSQIR